jgi:hypothetical protein
MVGTFATTSTGRRLTRAPKADENLRNRRGTAGEAMGSDVTAVVLTLGEATTERALASVRAQTLPPAEVVLVDRVAPFHAALNRGASQVGTAFFVQVDADMVLDPTCLETLRTAVAPRAGVVVGRLRDPLAGPVTGVKLFRTECFFETRMRDSVIQDVDFYLRLAVRGWVTISILAPECVHTVGEHRPRYSLEYTYGTYRQLGARFRYRRDARMLAWRLRGLRGSAHPLASTARLALGHGTFALEERDAAKPRPKPVEVELLRRVTTAHPGAAPRGGERLLRFPPERAAEAFWSLGRSLRAAGDHRGVAAWLGFLAQTPPASSWLPEACLCHGVLSASPAADTGALLDDMRRGLRDAEMLAPTPGR